MLKAEHTFITSRRRLLAYTPVGLLAGTTLAFPAEHPDAALLAHCAAYEHAYRHANDVIIEHSERYGWSLPDEAYREQKEVLSPLVLLEVQVAEVAAQTRDGRMAKARVARTALGILSAPAPDDEHALFWSLSTDVLAEK